MNDLVCSHVSVLSEGLATNIAVIRSFTRVSSFMGFAVTLLAEALTASRLLAEKRLDTSVDA